MGYRKALTTTVVMLATVGVGDFVAVGSAQQSTPFTATDMLGVVTISSVAVAPDASRVAFVLPDMDDEWNVLERRPRGYLHVREVGDGSAALARTAIQITDGDERSSSPAWSPNGRQLAFFIQDTTGGQLAVWDADTGAIHRFGAVFSGTATQAPQWVNRHSIVYPTPLAPPPPAPTPRVLVVESTDDRIPGDAYFARTNESGLAMVDIASGAVTELAPPQVLRSFSVAANGRAVVFSIPSAQTLGLVGGEVNETFVRALEAGGTVLRIDSRGRRFTWSPTGDSLISRGRDGLSAAPVTVTSGVLQVGRPRPYLDKVRVPLSRLLWSPDRRRVATLAADPSLSDPEVEAPQPAMYSIARPFMDVYLVLPEDGSAINVTSGIVDQISDVSWSPDGESIVFHATDNNTYDETLYRYIIAAERLVRIVGGPESYSSLAAGNDSVVVTIQSATAAPDLWRIDASGRHRLTDLNPQLARFRFSEPELFHFDSTDGERLGALLYRPAGGSEPAAGVITYIYEKLTPGIHRFNARQQMFVSHGYGVLMPNVKIKVGETGTSYVNSVVPAVEAVRAMGVGNGRFCLWGGSFGAYGSPFQFMERYIAQSAFFHLDQVETPVLLMHGVKDYTILFGEGEMMFYALRRLGKAATFVIYNNGDHSLSRHSRSDTLDVNRRMLAWFGKYLR